MTPHRLQTIALLAAGIAALPFDSASAYETGYPGYSAMPGVTIPATAGLPQQPGLYGFNQSYTRQSSYQGPGATRDPSTGNNTTNAVALDTPGLLIVPGWTFLGANYAAVIVQPFSMTSISAPKNIASAGIGNTYIAPVELSWRFGNGFAVKAGLGLSIPDGSMVGTTGLSSSGHPWWTIQPELLISYFQDGWTFSANSFYEISTPNTITKYRTGDILRVDWQATKKIGNWTVGPVGYYYGQLTGDTSSAFYRGAINLNHFNIFAAGLLVGYDFGRATLNVWATDDFYHTAGGGHPANLSGPDTASIPVGWKAFVQLNFRIYAFDEKAESQPRLVSK